MGLSVASCVDDDGPSSPLPAHPNIDHLPGSVRIRYRTFGPEHSNLPFRKFLRISKFWNQTGEPDHGNTEVSRSKPLAHAGTKLFVSCSILIYQLEICSIPGEYTVPSNWRLQMVFLSHHGFSTRIIGFKDSSIESFHVNLSC